MNGYKDKNELTNINETWITMVDRMRNFVDKQYLCELPDTEVCTLDDKFDSIMPVTLFKLNRLILNEEEGILDKLVNVYSAMHGLSANVFLLLHGNENGVLDYYIGCRSREGVDVTSLMLKSSLEGNFPGIELYRNTTDEKKIILDNCIPVEYAKLNLVSLSVSPGFRREYREKDINYIQGMEKFIDSMKGKNYTVIFLAEPIDRNEVQKKKEIYEDFASELTKYNKLSLGFTTGDSLSLSKTLSDSSTNTVTEGICGSVSQNISKSIGTTNGRNHNSSMHIFMSSFGSGSHTEKSKAEINGTSWTGSMSDSHSHAISHSKSEGSTETQSNSMSYTLNMENRRISDLINRIDYELEKLSKASSYGLWDTSVYVLSEEKTTAVAAANGIRSLVIGDDSGMAESFMNVWDGSADQYHNGGVKEIMSFLHNAIHPVFKRSIDGSDNNDHFFSSSIIVSGDMLPSIMGFPLRSVLGLTVMSIAQFGRNIVIDDLASQGKRKICIGNISYMGKSDGMPVELSVNSLSSHTFICGAPGSGKSNTVYKLLYELSRISSNDMHDIDEFGRSYGNVKFLVIEPAKGEYKYEFYKMPGINIYTTGIRDNSMLRINPFEYPYEYMDIQEHIEKLKNIIMACWPLNAAMPAILSDAIERSYESVGWDLTNSIFAGETPEFPDFYDVLKQLPVIIGSSDYSADTKGDYTGALVTRVASLTKGITSRIFVKKGVVSDQKLFDENTIIDISNIGSTETRSLIMGVLILRLENYRKSRADAANYPLRHVTVLEEAHNLLSRHAENSGTHEGGDLQGKSVDIICNAISEMRTMGEGFIIVDQSPARVSDVAVSNTSTKIIMRLPGKDDIETSAGSVGLSDKQAAFIPMLAQGRAIVKQGNWIDPVITIIDKAPRTYFKRCTGKSDYEDEMDFRGVLIKRIFGVVNRNAGVKYILSKDIQSIKGLIEASKRLPEHTRVEYQELWMDYIKLETKERNEQLPVLIMDILKFKNGIMNIKPKLRKIPNINSTMNSDEYIEIQKWRNELVKVLKYYVYYDEEIESELLCVIYDYCIRNTESKLLKVAAFFAKKIELRRVNE